MVQGEIRCLSLLWLKGLFFFSLDNSTLQVTQHQETKEIDIRDKGQLRHTSKIHAAQFDKI